MKSNRNTRFWALSGLGIVLMVCGAALLIAQQLVGVVDITVPLIIGTYALGGLLIFSGLHLVRRAQQHTAISGAQLLDYDERAPVLYLRSFRDDRNATRMSGGLGRWWLPSKRFEEIIAPELNSIGPFVALGQPGEKLPELGAARFYAGDGSWRQKVSDLLGQARFIVISTATTPSLQWEISEAVRLSNPGQLMLFFDDFVERDPEERERKYATFRQFASELFPASLPDEIGETVFFLFDETWNARAIGLPGEDAHERLLASLVRAVHSALPKLASEDSGASTRRLNPHHVSEAKRIRAVLGAIFAGVYIVYVGFCYIVALAIFPPEEYGASTTISLLVASVLFGPVLVLVLWKFAAKKANKKVQEWSGTENSG